MQRNVNRKIGGTMATNRDRACTRAKSEGLKNRPRRSDSKRAQGKSGRRRGRRREKEVHALVLGSSNLLDARAQTRGVGVRALAVGLVRIDKTAAEIFDWMR